MKNRIRELRKEKNMTLKQLSEKLGIASNTLSQYETGKREPQFGLMQELANYFNVSLDYLTNATDKRDYQINDDNDAIKLIKQINDGDLSTSQISKSTFTDLYIWLVLNYEKFKSGNEFEKYNNLASLLLHIFETDNITLKEYTKSRKEKQKKLDEIIETLTFDENTIATVDDVLKFINEMNRIGYDKMNNVFEYIDKIPSENKKYNTSDETTDKD
ncbi:helix-turn-helix domain-containing protein [Ligilactobacillus salivarius]|uniref:helix-turn-helix domain-containing protein n=1 Tax=Ligilactobacillus salivarius TaxID=1624 RepID=UPI001F2EAD6D|nr:helix-turn-helix domain-containing protein [Ligilactobacillus salivarius]MCF2622570.1 helix-turn-helix domain-containing protein [Ligilactobacillus salivarius]